MEPLKNMGYFCTMPHLRHCHIKTLTLKSLKFWPVLCLVGARGEIIHMITRDKKNLPVFWKILEEPVPHNYNLRFLNAMQTKHQGTCRVLSSTEKGFKSENV